MRIVAGRLKSMILSLDVAQSTRPTSDKVREALFSTLYSRINLEDIYVADLYAGTGALGLEAFSRGAAHVTFVETDKKAHETINTNISKALQMSGVDIDSFLNLRMPVLTFVKGERKFGQYDIVFADPPYAHDIETEILNIIAPGGYLVYETSSENVELCEKILTREIKVDEIIVTKTFGSSSIIIAQVI